MPVNNRKQNGVAPLTCRAPGSREHQNSPSQTKPPGVSEAADSCPADKETRGSLITSHESTGFLNSSLQASHSGVSLLQTRALRKAQRVRLLNMTRALMLNPTLILAASGQRAGEGRTDRLQVRVSGTRWA
ncbi:hypothetical protein EYF80_022390 [Liparis tanakae]|uniref:Uncharacterized protein n=1 Tax=Liparis tanakae TaxID=230148 RepID=A0A4Z2HR26_9TELE|nr:hypothetical protein EYF80_022390 [Liparis tanakae]